MIFQLFSREHYKISEKMRTRLIKKLKIIRRAMLIFFYLIFCTYKISAGTFRSTQYKKSAIHFFPRASFSRIYPLQALAAKAIRLFKDAYKYLIMVYW